jgi:hypothetical protein
MLYSFLKCAMSDTCPVHITFPELSQKHVAKIKNYDAPRHSVFSTLPAQTGRSEAEFYLSHCCKASLLFELYSAAIAGEFGEVSATRVHVLYCSDIDTITA